MMGPRSLKQSDYNISISSTAAVHLITSMYNWINPLMPNDLQRRCAVSLLKIKIPSKNMREKPINATIIYSVY
jgi:hypothetical protein